MRSRIISCAIDTLFDVGYAATSTMEVQRRAGVSRGALLHHFPTKIDLMIDTARSIVAQQAVWYDTELRRIPDKRSRLWAISRLTWEAIKTPSGMALLEIFLATRSDPDLHRRFPPVADELLAGQHLAMWRLARAAGVSDREAIRRLTDAGLALMRGLSIQLLYSTDKRAVEECFLLYRSWERNHYLQLGVEPELVLD